VLGGVPINVDAKGCIVLVGCGEILTLPETSCAALDHKTVRSSKKKINLHKIARNPRRLSPLPPTKLVAHETSERTRCFQGPRVHGVGSRVWKGDEGPS